MNKTGDKLIMSEKERQRQIVFSEVAAGRRSLRSASETLELSYRQVKRLWSRYKRFGAAGLVHRGRGKPSGRAYSQALKSKVIHLYETRYVDFGPQLFSEYLEKQEGICLSRETLRTWLNAAGLWTRKRKRTPYRQRRLRRARFGELLQIDGSDHHWFGEDHPRCCLLNMVDDATGTTLSRLASGETTQVLLEVLHQWLVTYGIPQAVYVDLKSVYISPKEDGFSVFQRVCRELGIQVIKAYSAQAKGRVERNHGVYQDRLVKGLRVAGINTIPEANRYLSEGFIADLNQKFARAPADADDGHAPLGDCQLDQILCWKEKRRIKNDRTFQFNGTHYQLKGSIRTCPAAPKKQIEIRVHLDGRLSAWYQETALTFVKIDQRPRSPQPEKKGIDSLQRSQEAKKNKHKTPWGKFNPGWLSPKQSAVSCAG